MSTRDDYIAGLRAVADLLERQPELPLPDEKAFHWNIWPSTVKDVPAEIARIARLLPGRLEKNDPTTGAYAAKYYTLTGSLRGVGMEVSAYRDSVCERVVTGTREVERVIPVTTKTVTETEDVVEWVCKPILAEAVER